MLAARASLSKMISEYLDSDNLNRQWNAKDSSNTIIRRFLQRFTDVSFILTSNVTLLKIQYQGPIVDLFLGMTTEFKINNVRQLIHLALLYNHLRFNIIYPPSNCMPDHNYILAS